MKALIYAWLFLFITHTICVTLTAQTPSNTLQTPIFDSLQLAQSDTLYFKSGSWDLSPTADSILRTFQAKPNTKIYLTGHTDDVGSIEFNEQLARKRANHAADSLLTRSWTSTQLHIQTFGERQPRNANQTDRERRDNRRVTIDLFRSKPYKQFLIRVLEDSTEIPIPEALVRFHNRTISDTLTIDTLGKLAMTLPIDSVVAIDAYAEGYFYKSQFLKIRPQLPTVLTIYLKATQIGAKADIANLYFVPNQAILLPKSRGEPEKVLRFLEINPRLSIEIAGHMNMPNTPPIKKNTSSWDLSVRRAKFLYDWLVERGVAAKRLKYEGYGNHEMRYPHAKTVEQQLQNMRVEIRVLDIEN